MPDGYKNNSLSFSNIKEAMGINFYCTNESIGAAIFKNRVMYSITDSTLQEFFTVDISPDAETSLVAAIQIDSDRIYVAAVANVAPSEDKLVFASKVISYEGLAMSIPTTLMHTSANKAEKENFVQI